MLPGATLAVAIEPVTEEPVEPGALPASASTEAVAPIPGQGDEVVAASPDALLASFNFTINTSVDEWSTDPANKASSMCSLREALQATVTGNPQVSRSHRSASSLCLWLTAR